MGKREVKKDEKGFVWIVNEKKSTRYPSGAIHIRVFENCSGGARTFVRYDEAGNPIAGNFALA